MFRILGDINPRLVVDEESGSKRRRVAKLCQDVPHPLDLLASLNCCHILSLSAGESDKRLTLRRPSHSTTTHQSHIPTSRSTSLLTTTMGSIRVGEKHLLVIRASVSELVITRTLEIAQKMLHCTPVGRMGIVVEATKVGDCIGNIWSS